MNKPLPLRSIVLNITTCTECPKHQLIQDPNPADPTRAADVAIVCTLSPNPTRSLSSLRASDQSPHRAIASGCRLQYIEVLSAVPDWCPLLHSNLFVKPS